jgi:hypothetical protein
MRGKLAFGAATAALLMFMPAALAQTADQAGDATSQTRLSESANGEFSPAGDVDWYRFSVEQGQRYNFTLEGVVGDDGNAVDPMLSIYDAEGAQLAFNDDAGGTLNSALQYAPQRSGEVFVEARAFNGEATGAYRLAVTSAAIPPDDAGNDASTRARIRSGQSATGNIEYEGDVDWYRLSARSGQTYRIALAGAGEGGLGDPLLRVIDAEGNELAANDDSEGSLNSALEFTPQASGNVFIEASAFSNAYAGAYTLSVNGSAGPRDNLAADRNTRGRLTVGQSADGVLDFSNDRDWYRVRLQEGQSYRFTLNSAGDSPVGDPIVRIHNAQGEELGFDDDGGDGLNSYLEFTAPATGNYFVDAGSFSEGTGGYTLAARAGDVPNDATTDASLSADGDYREGVLAPAGDSDWYRVDLAEGQGLRVGLASADTDPLGDPYLVLRGPDGAELLRDDDGGEGLNAWFEYSAATAGTYYVEARGFTEDASGRYVLTLTPGEIGASPDTAEYLNPNSDGRSSSIGANDDVDWYVLEMVEGRPYRIYLDGVGDTPLSDPFLTLYDSQGNSVVTDDDGGAGLNAYLSFVSPTGGPYFVGVSSFGSGSAGGYTLRAVDTDVPGHVNTDEFLDQTGDERLGRVEISGDLDNYAIELEGGVRYVIEVSGAGDNPLADPFLSVITPENQSVASDDDSGPGMDARLSFTPEATGAYFLQASGLGGSTGWYTIRIMRQ